MYPHFKTLYRAAVEKGLAVAILGNPCSEETMEAILAIERPVFFQVSLEGLEAHNDMIRGTGHFKRVLDFLDVLRNLRISSKVMLTLTKANMDQVLPLAELLRDRTDDFTFNRLSMVGEGANLQPPDKKDFPAFLKSYVEASRHNPTMGWKDNFINIVCHQDHADNFGGCTGYGCGAAFNFMAVLSDGEAHACRKFPSPIGNVYQKSISDIYEGKEAEKYRSGPKACRSCPLHLVCRGCLAVAYSHGLDIFTEQDPYCFMPGVPS
jgi:selenobiotic family peptide radical SAM maturase